MSAIHALVFLPHFPGHVFNTVTSSAAAAALSSSSSLGIHHQASFSSGHSSGHTRSSSKQLLACQSASSEQTSSNDCNQSFSSPSALCGSHQKPSSSSSSLFKAPSRLFGSHNIIPSSSSCAIFNAPTTIQEGDPLIDLHKIILNGDADAERRRRGLFGGRWNRRHTIILAWVASIVLFCGIAVTTTVLVTAKSDSSAQPSIAGGHGE